MSMYQVGGSLPANFSRYVKRQADEDLYEQVKNHEYCYVLNARQMGKSSLRVQTMKRLRADGVVCAEVDITRIGGENSGQWFNSFVDELISSFKLTNRFDQQAWWERCDSLTPSYRLSLFIKEILLREVTQPIVIFIDEIDSVLDLSFKDDLFALIRACYNQRADNPELKRLTFVLLGTATPNELIRDDTIYTPFNIGKAIDLQGFRLAEAKPLAQGLQKKTDNPREVLRQILWWSRGQPFLTQKLCQLVELGERIPAGEEQTRIAKLVKLRVIRNWESQDNPQHLRTIRGRLLSDATLSVQWLTIYQQILQEGSIEANNSSEQMDLRISGLVVQREGRLWVYNPIYRCVFNKNWVDEQLSQQRPYADNLRAWKGSNCQDKSQLLQGQTLREAQTWADDKRLSADDYEFLNASFRWEADQIVAEARSEAQLQEQQAKAAEAKATEADQQFETAQRQLLQIKQRLAEEEQRVAKVEQRVAQEERKAQTAEHKAKRWTTIGSGAIVASALLGTFAAISGESANKAIQQQKAAEQKTKDVEERTTQLTTKLGEVRKDLHYQKVEFSNQKVEFSNQISQQGQQLNNAQNQKEQAQKQEQKARKQAQNIKHNLRIASISLEQNKENLADIWGISRSVSLMSRKRYTESLSELERLLEKNPQNNFAWVAKGFAYYEMEQYEEALKCYEAALRINLNDALALSQRGNTLFKLENLEAAISSYDQAIKIDQNYAEAWNDKGVAWFTLGNIEKAVESYKRAIEINPDYSEAWYNQGIALVHIGAIEKAIESYDRATNINPDYADAWIRRGLALSSLGIERIDEAIDSYDEALKANENRFDALYFRGLALYRKGETQAAIESFERAIAINPNYASAWHARGVVLSWIKQYEAAIESFERATDINPNYADAWSSRGDALLRQEPTENLLLLPVTTVVPGNSLSNQRPYPVVIERPRPMIIRDTERIERALDSYNRAIAINPMHAGALYGRGNALFRLGRTEEAIASYNQALQLNRNYDRAWYGLGNAQFRLGLTEEALASYSRATDINPKYIGAWYNRGVTLLKLERYGDALESANRAIELNPEMGVAIRLREEILRHIGRTEDVNVPEQ